MEVKPREVGVKVHVEEIEGLGGCWSPFGMVLSLVLGSLLISYSAERFCTNG